MIVPFDVVQNFDEDFIAMSSDSNLGDFSLLPAEEQRLQKISFLDLG